jgi:mRNA interferase RelE/StbE
VTYTVLLDRQAEKELRSLPAQILRRIDKCLMALSNDPRPKGVLKLKGKESEGWRIRVGDYRIIYVIDEAQKAVMIYRIKHRRDVYRQE